MTNWQTWEATLPEKVEVPRNIIEHQEEISSINLHAIGDASSKGLSVAVYAVTYPPSGTSQGLLVVKSGLTIQRQKLVAGHMATNLLHNVKQDLQGFPIESVHCWFYSSVVLHWIKGVVYTSSLSVIKCRKSKTRNTSNGTMWV